MMVCLLMVNAVASPFGKAISEGGESGTVISPPEKPQNRAASLVALTSHLGVSESSVIADVGAGNGRDSRVFARIVGERGKVWAEEITPGGVDTLKKESEARGLTQVHPILGRTDDPFWPS